MDDLELNRAALEELVFYPQSTMDMIDYLAKKAEEVIICDPDLTTTGAAASNSMTPSIPSLKVFIATVAFHSQVPMPTLATTAVYLIRLRSRLPSDSKGMRCTAHRIFLACLILASKNLNESSPRNINWSRYTRVRGYDGFRFNLKDVNLMERQLLFLLDWDIRINEEDLFQAWEPFLAPIREEIQYDVAQAEWRQLQISGELLTDRLRHGAKTKTRDYAEINDSPTSNPNGYTRVASATSSTYSTPNTSLLIETTYDDIQPSPSHRHRSRSSSNNTSPPSITDLPQLSYPPSTSPDSLASSLLLSPRDSPASIDSIVSMYKHDSSKNRLFGTDDTRSLAVGLPGPVRSDRFGGSQRRQQQQQQQQQQPKKKVRMSLSASSASGRGLVARFLASAAGSVGVRFGMG